jgi:hypothetical protein
MLTVGLWGSLEIQVDPYTYALTGQLRLIGSLWVDIAVRVPAAFAALGPLLVVTP